LHTFAYKLARHNFIIFFLLKLVFQFMISYSRNDTSNKKLSLLKKYINMKKRVFTKEDLDKILQGQPEPLVF